MFSTFLAVAEIAILTLLPISTVASALPSSHVPTQSNASLYPPYTYDPGVYIPSSQGIPFTQYNGKKPWLTKPSGIEAPRDATNANCNAPPTASVAADDYWYANILHNGESPFITESSQYTVFRNAVTDFGVDPTGSSDSSGALQNAINAGTSGNGRNDSGAFGTTGQPAVIYLPPGTYLLDNPIQLYVDTFIVGNPISPPTLQAGSGFSDSYVVYGKDPGYDSTVNFYIGIKNLIIDSTAVSSSSQLTLLDWSVSQATQLTNVVFNMPQGSSHTGLATPEGGSGTMMGDLTFNGGSVGINMNNQQYEIKSVTFDGCTTGIYVAHCFDCVFVNCQFQNNQYGIDMTATDNTIGAIVLLDSTASSVSSAVVRTNSESTGDHSLVLENFQAGSGVAATVTASGNTVLAGSVSGAWVYGNAYTPGGPSTGSHQTGTTYTVSPPSALTTNGQYVTIPPPTYQDYPVSSFVNVKNVPGLQVYGDGVHDDTDNLNTIIGQSAGCSILFFPQGTYLVSNTLYFPPGSRVVGEALSTISANGPNFQDASNPIPMVQVGQSDSTGVAQFSDMLFTVADVLPGCILVQVNMAGQAPGDVGFWNSHFRIGGALGSNVYSNCDSPADCMAAFMVMQLSSSSSAYVENMWGWTADHDLDGDQGGSISTGRGLLVQGTAATWLHGVAFEHHTLYQFNMDHASNVFSAMQQSETPYWQGPGQSYLAPSPWTPNSTYADPDFSGCDSSDGQCRMAWFNIVTSSSDIYLHGGGFWTFFNDNSGDCQNSNLCQSNAINVQDAQSLYWFGISTHCNLNVVVNDGSALVTQNNNPGSWGACVAAFLSDS